MRCNLLDSQFPKNEQQSPIDQLQKSHERNPENFTVIAHVLIDPFLSGWHEFSIDGWAVIPTSGGRQYLKEFPISSLPTDWIKAINSLNKILLSYFICESEPRIIYGFELPRNLPIEIKLQLTMIFGNSINDFSIEDNAKKSFEVTSSVLHGTGNNDPYYQTDISLIQDWYEFFENNESVFNCVNMVRESFVIINKQFNTFTYLNIVNICTGIVLLVSALEGLFTLNQDNSGDIKFKFTTVGSTYYEKNVTEDFLGKYAPEQQDKKIAYLQFKNLLSELYNLRSTIAHGDYSKVTQIKVWKKFLTLMYVQYDETLNQALLSKNIAFALGLLEKHILALIVQSRADLHKGVNILDEMICKN